MWKREESHCHLNPTQSITLSMEVDLAQKDLQLAIVDRH